jgi:hypothetical protein
MLGAGMMRLATKTGLMRRVGPSAGITVAIKPRWATSSSSSSSTPRAVDTRLEVPAAAAADEGSEVKSGSYPFTAIEAKWQAYWEENQTFRTPDEIDTSKPKYYVLDMFPYPRCVVSVSVVVRARWFSGCMLRHSRARAVFAQCRRCCCCFCCCGE